jgi:hypothetical protein
MAQARVGVRVADDRKSVTIEIGPVDGPSSPVGLDLDQLTKVIALLGQARRRMLEGLQVEPLNGKTVETIASLCGMPSLMVRCSRLITLTMGLLPLRSTGVTLPRLSGS